MATKKKSESETHFSKEIDVNIQEPPAPKKKKAQAPPQRSQAKRVSFQQWAVLRDIPDRHRPGLLAYVSYPQKKRSINEWDACFKNY